jgi:hypothetical protein
MGLDVGEPLLAGCVKLGEPVPEGCAPLFILEFVIAEGVFKRDELSLLEHLTALYFLKTCIISCS